MAKKAEFEEASLESANPDIPKPRLIKLIVKNFRCIGPHPVTIDLDDIVVLVGANNVGKSSILKAYEIAMTQGSKEGQLNIEDFPNNKVDPDNLPEIELHTIVYDNSPGEKWIEILNNNEKLVKERWFWKVPGPSIREGWDVEKKEWSTSVPWGAPNVANSRRPEPHRIDAFASPFEQANAIKKLLNKVIDERIKNLKSDNEGENDYTLLLKKVKDLQKQIVMETQEQIDLVNEELSKLICGVFPNYKVDYDAKPEDNLEKNINFFKADAQLLMGPKDGYLSTIDRQGSGAQRTLLWAALKFISEENQKDKKDARPHLLLIDEPELCLHPSAIREASNVLYNLPNSGNWQVMATTHSPIFIDFSRNNTTIIRVDKKSDGTITGTTVFRPDKVKLEEDDKTNLKFLNLCDPYVAEFFFGGRVIIVEGDTEYTAFNHVKALKPELYKDIHIIRARGKATVVSLIKILNHFGSSYSVLHDSDTILTSTGAKNPAWTNNEKILKAIDERPKDSQVRLFASIPNFEQAYFGETYNKEKPYNALIKIKEDKTKLDIIENLLKSLISLGEIAPNNCIQWESMDQLEARLFQ